MSAVEQALPVSALAALPPTPDEAEIDALLAREIAASPVKLVVLDDDPTGVQTVHDVSVFTDWSAESLREGFAEPGRVFYILTNSRGMTPEQSEAAHREIAAATEAAAREAGRPYLLVSRSDSTLRGHYPLETAVLRACLSHSGTEIDGEILCPYFQAGGRYTLHGVHYVQQGDQLIPAAQTEFARDKSFGYTHSDLPGYIEEKTGGTWSAADVTCISIDDLRTARIDAITQQLLAVSGFGKVCVDAACDCDLKVFCIALYRALHAGRRFLFRTAAGFVQIAGGISAIPLLSRADMIQHETGAGGIVVVGSHTQKTTGQLDALLTLPGTVPVAFNSDLVEVSDAAFDAEVQRCVQQAEQIIRAGQVAVLYTSRTLLTRPDDTRESALQRSVKISDGVQRLVGELRVAPAFVVAKGGITSSDIGTKALRVRRATVLGQIRPGIPVWRTGPESRFPGVPFVIFPGNTGGEQALREAVAVLTGT